MTISGAL
ncbi:hypothetical protein CGLO_18302 [Colletotrichum gloeosporioides Cg-14]|nr:hypothetical protein CGLO_18302 [Colletotrichum gloeosporioides Cg-14]